MFNILYSIINFSEVKICIGEETPEMHGIFVKIAVNGLQQNMLNVVQNLLVLASYAMNAEASH